MKSTKDHLQDWERLEQKWQQKLSTHEEQLPDGLWEKLEGIGNREEGIGKKGKGKSVVLIRWSAAAAVLLFLFFWMSFEKNDGIGNREEVRQNETVPELVEEGKWKVESGKWKVESGKLKGRSLSLSKGERVEKNFHSKKERVMINFEPLNESIAQVSVKNEIPIESMETKEAVKSVESVKSVVQTEVDEMLVVVDVEPVKKEKIVNKIIGFIKKVKTGKILDLTTKARDGKLNDGIHRVMYQYEEKEEKLKNVLSL